MRTCVCLAAIELRDRLKYPHCCWCFRACPSGDKQTIKFGDKERRARARNCRNAGNPSIGRVLWLKNVEESRPAADVNAVALRIHEYVVCIAASLDGCDELAVRHGEDAELRWSPKDHKNTAASRIERHREIGAPIGRGPFADGTLRSAIDHGNPMGVGYVDKDLAGTWVDL